MKKLLVFAMLAMVLVGCDGGNTPSPSSVLNIINDLKNVTIDDAHSYLTKKGYEKDGSRIYVKGQLQAIELSVDDDHYVDGIHVWLSLNSLDEMNTEFRAYSKKIISEYNKADCISAAIYEHSSSRESYNVRLKEENIDSACSEFLTKTEDEFTRAFLGLYYSWKTEEMWIEGSSYQDEYELDIEWGFGYK